jgi:hypothetical protein
MLIGMIGSMSDTKRKVWLERVRLLGKRAR